MPEFKILKEITGEEVFNESPCKEEFNKFVKKHGWHEVITDEDVKAMPEAWTEWLEDRGFLEEIYTEPTYAGRWEDAEGTRKPGEIFFRCEPYSGGYVVHLVNHANRHETPSNMFVIREGDGKIHIELMEAFRDNSGAFQRSVHGHAPIYLEGYHVDNLLRLAHKYGKEAEETQEEEA